MSELPRAKCPVCFKQVPLRTNGTLREHKSGPHTSNAYGTCHGSGEPPEPTGKDPR